MGTSIERGLIWHALPPSPETDFNEVMDLKSDFWGIMGRMGDFTLWRSGLL
jgi:hypothetical protein